jgi:hypothetical protein
MEATAVFAATFAALYAGHHVGPDRCWPWQGSVTAQGYGRLKVRGRTWRAHRLAYEIVMGPIPGGRHLDHTCHDPELCKGGDDCQHRRCVNPLHLKPTTLVENVMRGASPAAQNARKTHCKRGHELTEGNLYKTKRGRLCATCARAQVAGSRARRKETRHV